MNKKYELSLLFYNYMNDETINASLKKLLEKSELEEVIQISSVQEIGRYDICYDKKMIKNIFICCEVTTLLGTFTPAHYKKLNKVIKNMKDITKFLFVIKGEMVLPGFIDYKYPIEMKKYIFESLRIMPRELTKFSKKTQRILRLNIQRARELGLIAKKAYG